MRICSLASGSSGNATFVATERTAILVDCGPPAREVVGRLASIGVHPSQIQGILISHAHVDHYRSAGTLNARYGIPVFVDPSAAAALSKRGMYNSWRRLKETFPIPERIGDVEVRALHTSHGRPGDGRTVAYMLEHRRMRVGVVTDLGLSSPEMLKALRGVDAIILEANYDEATLGRKLADPSFAGDWGYLRWVMSDTGHLSNRQCAETLAAIVADRRCHAFLGHVSENHHDPRHDNNEFLRAFSTVEEILRAERLPVPHLHRTFRIGLTRGNPSDLVEI